MIDVYILLAISIALINFIKSIPACISPGKGKNGSTVAVSASFQLQFCAKTSFCQARVQVQGPSQISNKRPGPGACSYNCNVTTTTTPP